MYTRCSHLAIIFTTYILSRGNVGIRKLKLKKSAQHQLQDDGRVNATIIWAGANKRLLWEQVRGR